MTQSFADRLKEAMRVLHVKQVDICEKTGIGKSAISQYLSGEFDPKQKNIYKIANALNLNEAWLLGFDVPMHKPISVDNLQPQEARCIEKYRSLDEDDQLHIENIITAMLQHEKYTK